MCSYPWFCVRVHVCVHVYVFGGRKLVNVLFQTFTNKTTNLMSDKCIFHKIQTYFIYLNNKFALSTPPLSLSFSVS